MTSGSDDKCLVPIKDIIQQALMIKTSAIILFHNHPSGSLIPSREDLRVTRKLKEAGALIDIELLDSIILTRESYKSLKDDSLI